MSDDLPRAASAGRRATRGHPEHARGVEPRRSSSRRDHGHRLRQPGHHRHHHARPVRLRLRPGPDREPRRHADCACRSSCGSGPFLGAARRPSPRVPPGRARSAASMERLAEFNLRHRVPILVATAPVTAISLVGVWRAAREHRPDHFFPESSPVRVRIDELQRSLPGGSGLLRRRRHRPRRRHQGPGRAPEHRGHAGLPASDRQGRQDRVRRRLPPQDAPGDERRRSGLRDDPRHPRADRSVPAAAGRPRADEVPRLRRFGGQRGRAPQPLGLRRPLGPARGARAGSARGRSRRTSSVRPRASRSCSTTPPTTWRSTR